MQYAIIAAGEGSRLRSEGITTPKPLVPVDGVPLLDRLIGAFMRADATSIIVVCRTEHPEVDQHLRELEAQLPCLTHIVRSTPSSAHSAAELAPLLTEPRCVMTTVDTVFDEARFREYIDTFEHSQADALMAVTDYIDDESPLFVSTDSDMRVRAFLDADTEHNCRYISAGIYGLTPRALRTLTRCVATGQSRMRNVQRALLADGLSVQAYNLGRVYDIDHASQLTIRN